MKGWMNWKTMTESLPAHALREVTLVLAERADLEAVNAALEREPSSPRKAK